MIIAQRKVEWQFTGSKINYKAEEASKQAKK